MAGLTCTLLMVAAANQLAVDCGLGPEIVDLYCLTDDPGRKDGLTSLLKPGPITLVEKGRTDDNRLIVEFQYNAKSTLGDWIVTTKKLYKYGLNGKCTDANYKTLAEEQRQGDIKHSMHKKDEIQRTKDQIDDLQNRLNVLIEQQKIIEQAKAEENHLKR